MPQTWAISGVDLHLDLTGTRVRARLEGALRDAVAGGRLPPGTRLPSSRGLAADLGIARNTVAEAYGQLVAEGWLVARTGSGTHVAERAPAAHAAPAPVAERGRLRYDLVPGTSDTAAFPRQAWIAAARRALNAAPPEALRYGDPRGRPELRRSLAVYLARARGVRVDPDRVVVCSGFTQGLALTCQVLRGLGAGALAMEAYGLREHRRIATAHGLGPELLEVDEQGAVLDGAAADAAVLTPAHQFPLGAALAATRRTEVVRWATEGGRLVVEDDYDGEFRYDRQPIGAMQALAPDHVIYAGTASKSLAPGLRLGWLVVPARLLDDFTAAKELADHSTSSLDQLVLAELMASGAYDRHVRRSRLAYRRRRDRLLAALREHAPHVRTGGIAAGLHVLLDLPSDFDEDEVIARAASHGLALAGLRTYSAPGLPHRPALVIGYGTPPEHAFTAAVARLVAVLGRHPGERRRSWAGR
jgi:GntR family transcriptional regulator/MocR family aminotransferase